MEKSVVVLAFFLWVDWLRNLCCSSSFVLSHSARPGRWPSFPCCWPGTRETERSTHVDGTSEVACRRDMRSTGIDLERVCLMITRMHWVALSRTKHEIRCTRTEWNGQATGERERSGNVQLNVATNRVIWPKNPLSTTLMWSQPSDDENWWSQGARVIPTTWSWLTGNLRDSKEIAGLCLFRKNPRDSSRETSNLILSADQSRY